MKRFLKLAAGAAGVTLVVGVFVAGHVGADNNPNPTARGEQQARDNQAIADVRAGKGRPLTAGEDVWSLLWWNCKLNFVKEHRTPYEIASPGSPGGKQVIHMIDSSRESFAAQLPPGDPSTAPGSKCDEAGPTQEELNAADAELNKRNARPGAPPPPDVPPPRAKR